MFEVPSKIIAFLTVSTGFLGICFLAYEPSRLMNIYNFLSGLGIRMGGDLHQISTERLKIWHLAWYESMQENFWLGSGYGTWLREFSKLPGSKYISYDTAHNLWVQLIFELGAIHVVAMVIILGLFVWTTLIYKNLDHPSLRIGGLFLMIGFFVASVVQEIDYILPVYLQFATFAGLCFGGTSYPESFEKFSSRNQFRVSKNDGNNKLVSLLNILLFKTSRNKILFFIFSKMNLILG